MKASSTSASDADPDPYGHGTPRGVGRGRTVGAPMRGNRGHRPQREPVRREGARRRRRRPVGDVLAGIDWVIYHRKEYNIRVMNLSLAADSSESSRTDPLARPCARPAAGSRWSWPATSARREWRRDVRRDLVARGRSDRDHGGLGQQRAASGSRRRHRQPLQLARSDARLVGRRARRAPRRQPAQARSRGARQPRRGSLANDGNGAPNTRRLVPSLEITGPASARR